MKQRVAAVAGQALDLRRGKPAERGPVPEPGRGIGGLLGYGSTRSVEAGLDGAFEGPTILESTEDGELFPFEAAKVDQVVHAMNGQVSRKRFEAGYGGDLFPFLTLGHGIAGDVGAGVVLNGQEEVVDGIAQIQQTEIGLEFEAQFRGMCALERASADGRQGRRVEGLDFTPFETDHVEGQEQSRIPARAASQTRPCKLGMFAEPGFELAAQVAHGEGTRGAIGQIGLRKDVEAALAQDGAEAGKILGEAVKNAEPVLAIVDFEALERREAVVRFDEPRSEFGEGLAVGRLRAHAFGWRKRGHDRAGDFALDGGEIHTAAAREALARYLLALSAS